MSGGCDNLIKIWTFDEGESRWVEVGSFSQLPVNHYFLNAINALITFALGLSKRLQLGYSQYLWHNDISPKEKSPNVK